jgi:hypothetical protein
MSKPLNRKLLSSGAAGVLVIAGLTAFVLNNDHARPTTSHSVTHEPKGTRGNRASAKLSSAGTNPASSATPSQFAALGHDWRITPSGKLYISTNGQTYYQVDAPNLVPQAASMATVVVTGSTVMVYPMPPQSQANPQLTVDVSHDGGSTWSEVHLPAAFTSDPADGQFVVSHGSVVGLLVNDETMPDFLGGQWYQTSNDGTSWTEYHTLHNTGGSQITQVGSTLWLLAGPAQQQLDESTNGGVSWSAVHFPGESLDGKTGSGCLYQVYPSIAGELPSGQTVMVTSKGPNGGCNGNMPVTTAAYESANNGTTWQEITSFTGTGQAVESPPSVALVQGDSIWVTVPGPNGQSELLHIQANGSHSLVSDPSGPSGAKYSGPSSLFVNAKGQLQVTLAGRVDIPSPNAPMVTSTYVSSDQGKTWRRLPVRFLASGSPVLKQP